MTTINSDPSNIGLTLSIKLTTEDGDEYIYTSRNVSNYQVFLEHIENNNTLMKGSHVTLQANSKLTGDEPQPVKAEVIEISNEGIELRFIL